jgi:hypothetical protein
MLPLKSMKLIEEELSELKKDFSKVKENENKH